MKKSLLLTITRSLLSPNSTTFLLFVTRVEARTCQATKHLRKIENRESVITNSQFAVRRTLLAIALCALKNVHLIYIVESTRLRLDAKRPSFFFHRYKILISQLS